MAEAREAVANRIARERQLDIMGSRGTSICIGFDALRIAVGQSPTTFTHEQVIRWLELMK